MQQGKTLRVVAHFLPIFLLAGCSVVAPLPVTGPAPTVPTRTTAASTSATPSPTITLPEPDALATALNAVKRKGIKASGIVVLDAVGGTVLHSRNDVALVPASSMKVVSTAAAVDVLGAAATFTTSVVRASAKRIVLVGGGDPYLVDSPSKSSRSPASLQALAAATASALKADKVRSVSLGYDASRFTGPAWNPGWPDTWRTFTPPVSALTVGGGRYDQWTAHRAPAEVAAKAFAAQLRKAGISVTSLATVKAPAAAATVASVTSAPLSRIVAHILTTSDNAAAEIVGRQAALAAGQPGSTKGVVATVRTWLNGRGLSAPDTRLLDASGLAKKARLRPSTLAGVIRLSLTDPRLGAVAAGLPVAGRNGTLKDRFDDPSEKAGRGVVHAKTGTLTRIGSLTGYLTTADGAVLAFAAIANDAPGKQTAYNWLDRTATKLVGCGCR